MNITEFPQELTISTFSKTYSLFMLIPGIRPPLLIHPFYHWPSIPKFQFPRYPRRARTLHAVAARNSINGTACVHLNCKETCHELSTRRSVVAEFELLGYTSSLG